MSQRAPAETILPGGSGFDIRRDFGDDADIDVLDNSTLVTNGPAGVIDDTSLDGGTSSSHGFAVVGTLPGSGVFILSRSDPGEIVTFSYLFGAGCVIYSSIPLDFYLKAPKPNLNFRDVYAPNVMAYAASKTTTLPSTDLAVEKTVDNPTPDFGTKVTFTIKVTNNGPSNADVVEVTDLLPAGLDFVSATTTQGTYNDATGLWGVGTVMTSTATLATLTIDALVNTLDPVTNTATITNSSIGDPDPSNNTDGATVTPQAADFSLDKTVNNATPDYQTNVVFTLTLTNLGPTPGVATVTDLLPSGLTFVSADPAADYNDATGTWTTDVVAVGDTRMLTITARVETLEPVTNEAAITGATPPDPEPSNNSASAAITPVASDLAITKTLADFFGDPATNTITATFKLTVTNNGPSDATGVVVKDPLPTGATLVSASGAYDADTGIWTIGALTNGASAMLTIVLTADAEHNLINIAVVSGDQPDQDLSNNLSGTQAQHDGPNLDEFVADLSLTKTVDTETPSVGDLITYILEVTNRGPSATAGVVVLDTLAAGLEFVSAETTSEAGQCPKCGYNDMLGVWTIGHLALDAKATLKITVRVLGTGEITNTAEIIENHLPDRNGDNDIASATITAPSTQAKATATEDEAGVPEAYALRQNYPNPFNPETTIRFGLPEAAYVRLVVYDAMGRQVARLVDQPMGAGRHAVRWEATGLPSGAYLYSLTAGTFSEARVMVLLR